jgi:hypothetical protein
LQALPRSSRHCNNRSGVGSDIVWNPVLSAKK